MRAIQLAVIVTILLCVSQVNSYAVNDQGIHQQNEPKTNNEVLDTDEDQIPRIVHYVYGFKEESTIFKIQNYLAVRSANDMIQPETIYFWCKFEPLGEYWESVKHLVQVKTLQDIQSTFGENANESTHFESILKLLILNEYGGIYLDTSNVCLKSFHDLLDNQAVFSTRAANDDLICDQAMMSKPQSNFLRRWINNQESGQIEWNPRWFTDLAHENHNEVKILPYGAFCWLNHESEVEMHSLLIEKNFNLNANHYSVKIFAGIEEDVLFSKLSLSVINEIDTSLFCRLRRFTSFGYNQKEDPNCHVADNAVHEDGTIGYWSFDRDTPGKIFDDLGNNLNGWGIDLSPRSERSIPGQYRHFTGDGSIGVIPSITVFPLKEFTVFFKFKMPKKCKTQKTIVSLYVTDDFYISIETDCVFRNPVGECSEIRVTNSKDDTIGIFSYNEDSSLHFLNNGKWHDIAVTASEKSNQLHLYVDRYFVGSSHWTVPVKYSEDTVRSIWLGTKPLYHDSQFNLLEQTNYKGFLEDFVVAKEAFNIDKISEISKSTNRYFQNYKRAQPGPDIRPLSLSMVSNSSIPLMDPRRQENLEKLQQQIEAVDAVEDSNQPMHTGPLLPEKYGKLPDAFTYSFILSLKHSSVDKTVKDFLFFAEFIIGPNLFEIGVDLKSGQPQIFNRKFWEAVRPIKNFGCHMSPSQKTLISVTVNRISSELVLYCNNVRMFSIGMRPVGLEDTTDIKMDRTNDFSITFFENYDGLFDIHHTYPVLEKHLEYPMFTLSINDTYVLEKTRYSDLSLEAGQPYMLKEMPDYGSPMKIEPFWEFPNKTINPIIQVTDGSKLLVIANTTLEGNSSVTQFEYKCLGIDFITVIAYIPDIWVQFSWVVECRDRQIPLNINKFVAEARKPLLSINEKEEPVEEEVMTLPSIPGQDSRTAGIKFSSKRSDHIEDTLFPLYTFLICLLGYMLYRLQNPQKVLYNRTKIHAALHRSKLHVLVIIFGIAGTIYYFGVKPEMRQLSNVIEGSSKKIIYAGSNVLKKKEGKPMPKADQLKYFKMKLPPPFTKLAPFFTIITPCYNQSQFLIDAAQSVVRQSYNKWEWIIINDGGPGNCLDTALKVQSQNPTKSIRVYDKPNSGLADTRNFGIQRAFADWICLLDSDDTIHYRYLEEVSKIILSKPHITSITANQQFFGESVWRWDLSAFSPERMRYQGLFPVQSIFRKWDWALVGGFNPSLPWGNEDWSFWISISHLPDFKVYKISELLLNYRYKKVSMQREKEIHEMEVNSLLVTLHPSLYSTAEVIGAHRIIIKEHTEKTKKMIRLASVRFPERHNVYLWLGIYAEAEGLYLDAISYYDKTIEVDKYGVDWQPYFRKYLISKKVTLLPHKVEYARKKLMEMRPNEFGNGVEKYLEDVEYEN